MALLVDGSLSEVERQHCLAHLAECQSCYDEWRLLSMENFAGSGKVIKGPWLAKRALSFATAGSLLAAAASILLYINLAPPPPVEHKATSPIITEDTPQLPMSSEDAIVEAPQQGKSLVTEEEPMPAPALVFQQEAKKNEMPASPEVRSVAPRKRKDAASKQMSMAADFEMEEQALLERDSLTSVSEEIMVDIANVVPVVIQKMSQLNEGGSLVLLTYKRDRSLTLVKLDQQRVLIKEKGFSVDEFEVGVGKLKKNLKSLLKKEFPRSNMVRIVTENFPAND
ncbi:MAG: zf-HC2 domain-containing protein [Thermodesulfobacteriota bacterium]